MKNTLSGTGEKKLRSTNPGTPKVRLLLALSVAGSTANQRANQNNYYTVGLWGSSVCIS